MPANFSGMFFDSDEFIFDRVRRCLFGFCLIEKIHLAFDVIASFFAGFAKEFFGKIIDLFLKIVFALDVFFFAFVGCFDQGIKVLDRDIQFLDGILQLYELLVSGIFCHSLFLLRSDTSIIPDFKDGKH